MSISARLEFFVTELASGFEGHSAAAAGRYAVKSEGMFPYDTHYVLATDEEIERLNERAAAMGERLCA